MKRIHVLIALMLLSTLFMAMDCDGPDVYFTDVTFVNKSEDTLFVSYECAKYSDLVSPENVLIWEKRISLRQLLPNEKFADKAPIPNEKYHKGWMNVFLIFKKSTMKKYSDEELAEKNIYDKKLSFTYEELEEKGFLVEYDGN